MRWTQSKLFESIEDIAKVWLVWCIVSEISGRVASFAAAWHGLGRGLGWVRSLSSDTTTETSLSDVTLIAGLLAVVIFAIWRALRDRNPRGAH